MGYLTNLLPYGSHLTHNIIYLPNIRGYMAVIKVFGTSFELNTNQHVNLMANRLANLWTNLGKRSGDQLAIWITIDRHTYTEYVGGEYPEGSFSERFNQKYKNLILNRGSRVNDIYISLIYRPLPNQVANWLSRMFEKVSKEDMILQQREDISVMEGHLSTVLSGISEFYPDILTTYMENDIVFSEVSEFLHYLAAGFWKKIPLSRKRIADLISDTQLVFGSTGGIVQVTGIAENTQSVILGNDDIPRNPNPKLLDDLLTVDADLIITHSFEFIEKQNALSMMDRHRSRMENAADKAVNDIADISVAEELLVAGDTAFGDYHFTVQVFGESKEELRRNSATVKTILNNAGLSAFQHLQKTSAFAFLSRMPGNFSSRTKLMPVSSDNFAHLAPLHNFPMGRKDHTQWRYAVAQFVTAANTPFFLNLHKDDEGGDVNKERSVDPDKKLPANMMIFGRTGSGKSTFMAALITLSLKYWEKGKEEFMAVMLDLDGSQANQIRGNRGRYFTIQAGQNTGMQPLQLEPTPLNRELVRSLILLCIKQNENTISAEINQRITHALAVVMSEKIPKENRRWKALLEFFSPAEDIYAEILQWCEGSPFGWVFDSPKDELDLDGTPLIGFDNTSIFGNPFIQERVYFYLLQRLDSLLNGRRFLLCVEELGQLGTLSAISKYFESKQVRIRKFNAAIIGLMQYPGQAIGTPFEKSIATQPTTHIYFPDRKGSESDFLGLMKLTRKEFSFIQNTPDSARQCLIKQGDSSVIVDFNLQGIGDEVSILSSNPDTAAFVEGLIQQFGDDPDIWMPHFINRRKNLMKEPEKTHED